MLKRGVSIVTQGCVVLYACVVVALVLLRALPLEYKVIHIFFVFLLYVFLPLLLLVPLALMWRSLVVRLAVGLVVALFLFVFGWRFLPPQHRADTANLRVVSFNQLYGNRDFDGLASLLRELDADVVAIQEFSEPFEEQAFEQLSDVYPYQSGFASEHRLGVLSKFPLEQVEIVEGEFAQQMFVVVGEQRFTLFNVHLDSPILKRICEDGSCRFVFDSVQRNHEYPQLLALLQSVDGPFLALGDFNTNDSEPWYERLQAEFVDVFAEANWGFGFTFPNDASSRWGWLPFPLIRLDYVWGSQDVVPVNAQIDCSLRRSDHCMMIADVLVP
jgi:vancomycin resistance protein VanJ